MWTAEQRQAHERAGLRYPGDLADAAWAPVEPPIPPARRGGRQRTAVVREHWPIENRLRWPLDVVLDQDLARAGKDHAPRNLALLRRLTLNVLRAHPGRQSINLKRQRAGWDDSFLLEPFTHMR